MRFSFTGNFWKEELAYNRCRDHKTLQIMVGHEAATVTKNDKKQNKSKKIFGNDTV